MPAHEDQTIRRAFGLVIRSLRKGAGLSQEEFGESAGVHRTYVSMMERGIKAPTVVTLVDLSRALGMTTSELMLLFDRELSLSLATQNDERQAARREHL
jgi:transcriptional regulator with XRE-family HTH domain